MTTNSVRGGREEGEHLGRPVLVSLLDGGDEVLLRHLQQHSRLKPTQADTFFVFFFFVSIFSFDFLGGGFLLSSEGGEDKAAERAALHSSSSLCCASKPIGSSSASALKPLMITIRRRRQTLGDCRRSETGISKQAAVFWTAAQSSKEQHPLIHCHCVITVTY